MPNCACGSQRITLWNRFSPSIFTQVPGTGFRFPGLHYKRSTHGAILKVQLERGFLVVVFFSFSSSFEQ